ncbi:WXG100-like domain-containing protein [Saccharopolyspora pogona]|uniref:WXG100-like domain-containing protein n=1 Tax=Saccharopolyspora pogona TaxID=333966 RepID=UPI001686960A|nr:hypothetical protein [Saccharopolyspora pogona]
MFSSIMVPEGVRRLFQVLTGEDMTDADEGGLFAVADALESGAVGVGEVGGFVAELVGKVRTEFSGKAADRFAGGLEVFDGLLASGEGALRELAVFVRDLARQVRYLKLVTIYGLELLLFEMAWAVYWAGATGGASMAWLAARMAVMRFLLSRWWGQLFMRLAMAAAGGVAFNVVPDLQAQLQMLGEKSSDKWDGKLTEQAAGMGAFSALVSLPLSAVGGLVGNALTKVLVQGLGDEVDAAILEAAVKKAVAEHAELYPVSAMAKFADVVAEHLDVYAGMSVRGMWLARFGEWVGEALENALSELLGEVGYLAATGQEVTWNPFSVTAGAFETVFSGLGNLAGLAWRGKLHPDGPSPYLDGTGRGEGGSDDGGGFDEEKTPLLGIGSGSQTGNPLGSPGKDSTFDSSDSSDSSDVSGVDSVFSGSDTGSVDSAAVSVPSGDDLVVSGSPPVSAVAVGTDGKGGTDGKRGADGGVPGGTPARGVPVVPGSGQDRPGTPPPAYSDGAPGFGSNRPVTPPPYSPVAGDDQAAPGKRPLEVHTSKTQDSPAVTPHASGVPADAARPEAVGSGSVVDSDGRVPADAARPEAVGSGSVVDSDGGVPAGHPASPSGMTGRDGDPGADSVAGRGDSHRQDGAVVSPDSATLSGEGAQAAPSLHRDPAAVLPVGLPADTVRVPVPADVVAGGGLAEFVVRGGVADSTGGPVLLVSHSNPNAGVVVTPGQGSELAKDIGRNVVAMTQRQGRRGPQFTVFAADGSRPRPLAGPGAAVLAGGSGGVAGLAKASATVPAASGGKTVAGDETTAARTVSAQERSGAGEVQPAAITHDVGAGTVRDTGGIPVEKWSKLDLDREIARAKKLGLSSDEKEAAGQIVWLAHDVQGLARADAVVPLKDVVALVAAKRRELGDDHQDQVVEFSRALADRLGTRGSGLRIRAGAGPVRLSDVDSAPVPFGELMPLERPVDAKWASWFDAWMGKRSETRPVQTWYMQGDTRVPLKNVVGGRVVLGPAGMEGLSREGRAAVTAFETATGQHAQPLFADVDGRDVEAFLRVLDWLGVLGHVLVVRKKTQPEAVDARYVMGEYAQGERSRSAARLEDLRRAFFPLDDISESDEFYVHVVDPVGVGVAYGVVDQGLWLRGRDVEWGGLFEVLDGYGPAELMGLVNPGVRRHQYLAQALGVDEATAQVWRMWSYLPEGWHAEALRRVIIGSVVSTYGGREEVKSLVKDLLPDGPPYEKRLLRALGQFMVGLADRRRRLGKWGEEGRDTRSAADYLAELRQEVARLGGLDEVVRAGSEPDSQVQVRVLYGPPPQRAGVSGRQPSRRELNVLHELVHALDGRELDYLKRFLGKDLGVAGVIGASQGDVHAWLRGRPGDRAVVRGILLDTFVAAFGGPEGAVALANRLRELGLGPLKQLGLEMASKRELDRGVQVASQRQPDPETAERVLRLLPMEAWLEWTLGGLLDYVAVGAVPAGASDQELVRKLGTARAALVAGVDESTAQKWRDGSKPAPIHLRRMREAARLPGSEVVRYLGPGRALEVTDTDFDWFPIDESDVWKWLAGVREPPRGSLRSCVWLFCGLSGMGSSRQRRSGWCGVRTRYGRLSAVSRGPMPRREKSSRPTHRNSGRR